MNKFFKIPLLLLFFSTASQEGDEQYKAFLKIFNYTSLILRGAYLTDKSHPAVNLLKQAIDKCIPSGWNNHHTHEAFESLLKRDDINKKFNEFSETIKKGFLDLKKYKVFECISEELRLHQLIHIISQITLNELFLSDPNRNALYVVPHIEDSDYYYLKRTKETKNQQELSYILGIWTQLRVKGFEVKESIRHVIEQSHENSNNLANTFKSEVEKELKAEINNKDTCNVEFKIPSIEEANGDYYNCVKEIKKDELEVPSIKGASNSNDNCAKEVPEFKFLPEFGKVFLIITTLLIIIKKLTSIQKKEKKGKKTNLINKKYTKRKIKT